MARTTRSPTDAQIKAAMRDAFALNKEDMDNSAVSIRREGTRMTVDWFGGLVRDFCEVDGDLALAAPSVYWANRRKFADILGVVVEDRYNGYDLFLREDY